MFLDVSRATGDEATRKVAGDRKARSPPFIFAFFPGMRSRYLQSLLLQSVRHTPAHAHLYLAASDWFRLLLVIISHLRLVYSLPPVPGLILYTTCFSDLRSGIGV